jgi:hypothetical protein
MRPPYHPETAPSMNRSCTPIVCFHRLIDQARLPQRADRSAAGTLPTRAYRYCEAVTTAAGYGWWVFPPADLLLLWDGHDIFWQCTGVADWLPLMPSAQFPDFSARFDAAAPGALAGCSPPFLTALPEPGTLQIWTGLIARTAPDWSLLIRAPANLPSPGGYALYELSSRRITGSVRCSPISVSPAATRRCDSERTFRSPRSSRCPASPIPRRLCTPHRPRPTWRSSRPATGPTIRPRLRHPMTARIERSAHMRSARAGGAEIAAALL